MAQGRPYQAYQNTGIQTANQKQLILMLYNGMIRFMTRSIKAIENGDVETAHNDLSRVGKIIMELLGTLREDRGGEIARNLKRLYVYSYEQIVLANLKKDADMVRDVREVMASLRDGWEGTTADRAAKDAPRTMSKSVRMTG